MCIPPLTLDLLIDLSFLHLEQTPKTNAATSNYPKKITSKDPQEPFIEVILSATWDKMKTVRPSTRFFIYLFFNFHQYVIIREEKCSFISVSVSCLCQSHSDALLKQPYRRESGVNSVQLPDCGASVQFPEVSNNTTECNGAAA